MKTLLTLFLSFFIAVGAHAQTQAPTVRVLMFHHVANQWAPGETVTHRQRFREFLDVLDAEGYKTLTISELVSWMRGGRGIPAKTVVLTFDDSWDDHMFVAGLLYKRKMRATFYVITNQLDKLGRLSKRDIDRLALFPNFEVGAHSHTHDLYNPEKDAERMFNDAQAAGDTLARLYGMPVNSYSWPYGLHPLNDADRLKRMGYGSAVVVGEYSDVKQGDHQYRIPRLNIDGRCSTEQFRGMLQSGVLNRCTN